MPRAKMLFFSVPKQNVIRRPFSRLTTSGEPSQSDLPINRNTTRNGKDSTWWVPHPRTGIYYPEGHERMMEDVPDGAASFPKTCWLRNVDGVDRPDPAVCPNISHHS